MYDKVFDPIEESSNRNLISYYCRVLQIFSVILLNIIAVMFPAVYC